MAIQLAQPFAAMPIDVKPFDATPPGLAARTRRLSHDPSHDPSDDPRDDPRDDPCDIAFAAHRMTRHYPAGLALPRPGELQVWRFRCGWLPVSIQEGESWLSDAERERARHNPNAALRKRFVAARVVLRWIVANLIDAAPHAVRFADAHARPSALALARGGPPVAIDIAYGGIWVVIGIAASALGLGVAMPAAGRDDTLPKGARSSVWPDARDLSDLHDARDLRDLRAARDARDLRDLRDAPDVRDVRDVRDGDAGDAGDADEAREPAADAIADDPNPRADASLQSARVASLSSALGRPAPDPTPHALRDVCAARFVEVPAQGRWHVVDLPMPGKIRAAVSLAQPVSRIDAFGWPKG